MDPADSRRARRVAASKGSKPVSGCNSSLWSDRKSSSDESSSCCGGEEGVFSGTMAQCARDRQGGARIGDDPMVAETRLSLSRREESGAWESGTRLTTKFPGVNLGRVTTSDHHTHPQQPPPLVSQCWPPHPQPTLAQRRATKNDTMHN